MLSRIAVLFMGVLGVLASGTSALALQAGGVEVGDLETGSVVGQPFKELVVDAELYAVEIGNMKAWYPPTTVIDFQMIDTVNAASPFVLKAEVRLKPGETKYIGVPTSDLFNQTQGNTLEYRDQLNPKQPGGKLLMIK